MKIFELSFNCYYYWESEYILFICYFIVSLVIVFFIFIVVLNLKSYFIYYDQVSQYECGFEPFGSMVSFDIQYYLIGILYLIFDIELVLLVPFMFYIAY